MRKTDRVYGAMSGNRDVAGTGREFCVCDFEIRLRFDGYSARWFPMVNYDECAKVVPVRK